MNDHPARPADPRSAIVLLAHGSRDPQWAAPIEALASAVAAARGVEVAVACLELRPPDLMTAGLGLAAAGATEIVVVPLFLGAGRHVREDLPRLVDALRAALPDVTVRVTRPIIEEPSVRDALAAGIGRCVDDR